MKFSRSFEVRAPLGAVRDFHARSQALVALTPPLMPMRLESSPPVLQSGDTMSFRIWLGPLPVRWTARIADAGPTGFTDRQLAGPFAEWVHRHTFDPTGPGSARVTDLIQARLRPHLLWGPVGLAMWLGLPLLFAFRAWKTRRLLEAP
jgi:ligand-binding SRPBCC domain-containing protein